MSSLTPSTESSEVSHVRWSSDELEALVAWMKRNPHLMRGKKMDWYQLIAEQEFRNKAHITPKRVGDKLSNVHKQYEKAKELQKQSGWGLSEVDNDDSVNKKLNKICPFFWNFDEVWGKRIQKNPVVITDPLAEEERASQNADELELQNNHSTIIENTHPTASSCVPTGNQDKSRPSSGQCPEYTSNDESDTGIVSNKGKETEKGMSILGKRKAGAANFQYILEMMERKEKIRDQREREKQKEITERERVKEKEITEREKMREKEITEREKAKMEMKKQKWEAEKAKAEAEKARMASTERLMKEMMTTMIALKTGSFPAVDTTSGSAAEGAAKEPR